MHGPLESHYMTLDLVDLGQMAKKPVFKECYSVNKIIKELNDEDSIRRRENKRRQWSHLFEEHPKRHRRLCLFDVPGFRYYRYLRGLLVHLKHSLSNYYRSTTETQSKTR